MDETTSLVRLMTWLSPSFPVGAFAYSHGLERAIHDGVILDRGSLLDWLSDLLERGSGWNDAVLLAEAWRTDAVDGGAAVAELAETLAGSRERHLETMLQGQAFELAAAARDDGPPDSAEREMPYAVAVGLAAARQEIGLNQALAAYLHAFTSNLVQCAVRLVPLGQRDGVAALARLEPVILAVANRAAGSTLDDLGSCTMMSDILSMKHEIQYSRVFRS